MLTPIQLQQQDFINFLFPVTNFWTGVGSRERPKEIARLIVVIPRTISLYGKTLRTGDASGCDSDFTKGCMSGKGKIQVFSAADCTPAAQAISASILGERHWSNCKPSSRLLLGRNSMQVLGKNLDSPTSFVICYTKDGESVGGTKVAIELAKSRKIPVYNLWHKEVQEFFVNGLCL